MKKYMKILFSGGGTLGPVTPLLAIKETIDEVHSDVGYVWIGTKRGPERQLIEDIGIPFHTIPAGKLRRYFSFLNLVDVFRVVFGFLKSFVVLWREQPDICITAGGFVSVPIHAAAWLMGIPTWVHSQDVQVGLATKLMSKRATRITTALAANTKEFNTKKTEWLGNPIREDVLSGSRAEAYKLFSVPHDKPVVLAMGGGTGSLRVNQLVVEAMEHIYDNVSVIHLSGKERPQELVERATTLYPDYRSYTFFTHEMKHAYAAADIIITRGGFGSLSEIAALGKPAIVIPKPGHQVENVRFLEEADAAILMHESLSSGLELAKRIKELLNDENKQKNMSARMQHLLPRADKKRILTIIDQLMRV